MHCINCGAEGSWLCNSCKKKLKEHPEICPICHKPSKNFKTCFLCKNKTPIEGLIICFKYHSIIKKLILKLKFYHKHSIAKQIAQRLYFCLMSNEEVELGNNIYLTYVPTHRIKKFFVKGYNQSKLIAKQLEKISGIKLIKTTKRNKNTKTQTKLTREQRIQNLKNVFEIEKDLKLSDETIIIVDDVTTTGTTIIEIAKTLKNQFPNTKIRGLVAARNF